MTTKQTRIGKGLTAIYVRRSVADRDNNSLSIEAQKEDCLRFIGANCAYHRIKAQRLIGKHHFRFNFGHKNSGQRFCYETPSAIVCYSIG